jgi:tetratricopeptide (TPR) repeat protein
LFERLRQNPVMQRDAALFAHLLIAESLQRSGLSDAERVARLEKAQAVARSSRHQGTISTAQVALARVLELAGQHSRALATLREIYDREPTCYEARWAIPRLLGILGRYREAVRFFEDEMQRWGPSPDLQCNYGHVLLRAGDADRAANILATVARDSTVSEKLRAYASTWRDKALETGGRLSCQAETSATVLLSDVNSVISDFSNYVKRAKRMEFWRRGKSPLREHRWTNEPERLAKNLLHTYVVSHFKAQVDAFEEVGAGAGRIDVYLRFEGGLAVLVELKMLGGGSYSSAYAWEGRKQLVHYMDNRRSAVGYLVVFDARQREWGKPPEPDRTDTERTIELVFVDVRPVVIE